MPIFLLDKATHNDFFKHVDSKIIYSVQTTPFNSIHNIMMVKSFSSFVQIIGNLSLLIPIAFIVVWIMNKTNKVVISLCGLIITCLIELIQFFINCITAYPCHAVDIDDIILNYIGYLLAVLIIYLIKKYNNSSFYKVRALFLKQ